MAWLFALILAHELCGADLLERLHVVAVGHLNGVFTRNHDIQFAAVGNGIVGRHTDGAVVGCLEHIAFAGPAVGVDVGHAAVDAAALVA